MSYAYWTRFGQKKPTITTDPTKIKFSRYLRVTLAFEPAGVTPKLPLQASINAMFAAAQSTTSTTVATPSTLPATTTTVKTLKMGPPISSTHRSLRVSSSGP